MLDGCPTHRSGLRGFADDAVGVVVATGRLDAVADAHHPVVVRVGRVHAERAGCLGLQPSTAAGDEAGEQLVDPVSGDGGCKRGDRPGRALGVGAVHAGLVTLAAGPERQRRRRRQERPALQIGRRARQRVDQRGVTVA